MGDLDLDTRVTLVDEGRCVVTPSEDWRIWGPMGGYIAAIALRAAATGVPTQDFPLVPASFSCQFFAPARFEPVDIAVSLRRSSRRSAAVAVSVTQDGEPVLDAQAWFAAESVQLTHDHAVAPPVPGPNELPSIRDLVDGAEPAFPFWHNLDVRPIGWVPDWTVYEPGEPRFEEWLRFVPTSTFSDPLVEACRLLIMGDLPSWPAATRAHARDDAFYDFVAPNLDLAVQFHRLAELGEWLLCAGTAPVAERGLIGFRSEVWDEAGRLVASGAGQLFCRPNPSPLPRP